VGRVWQHREGEITSFTERYGCTTLVYFELFEDMAQAITREKQLKGGSRAKKIALIERGNPQWRDLYDQIVT
jgi:putative endonuclease